MGHLVELTDKRLDDSHLGLLDERATSLEGALSRRGLGVLLSNAFVASADDHSHHKHSGTQMFAQLHRPQTNNGRSGQRRSVGRESDGARC